MDTSRSLVYAGLPRNEFTECKLGELADKLWIYFQRKNVSQGCDVDSVSSIESDTSGKLWMKVIFSEPSGAQHVVSKSQHELKVDGWEIIPLEVRKSFPSDESSQSDDNESFDYVDAVDMDDPKGALASDSHGKTASATHVQNQSASQKGFPSSQQSGLSRNAATLNLTAHAASPKTEETPSGPVSTQRASNSGGDSSTQSFKDNTAGGEGSYQDTDDADLYGPDPKEPCIKNEAPTMRTSSSEEAVSNYTRGKGSETQEQGSFQAEAVLSAGTSRNHQPVDGKQCQFTGSGKKQNGSSKRSEPKIATRQNDTGKQDGHVPQEMTKSSDGPAVPSGHTSKRKRNRGKAKKQSPKESPEEKRTAPERQENNEVSSHRDDQVQEGDSPNGQQVEEEQEEKFVEVTGFSPSSEEMLKMHFENSRRSGGGEIETWEHDVKTGAIRLTYQDPSLVSKVIAKQHKVGGATLSVRLVVKKKPRPRPVNKRCLLLKGIPDECTSDLVAMFVENRCGTEDFEIRYGEMPGTALCTFNEDIEDLENVIKKISLKKLKGLYVTAEKVHESDCILVQGVSSRESLEMIELYFDNKKKSGGEGVRDVQQGPEETQAIVFFDDWKVIRDVLSKKGPHKVGGVELSVEEYHECLGRISPLDVPTPHIPKPVSVQVPQAFMEFIFGQKGQHTRKTLVQKLSDVKASLKWPDGDDKTVARLEPLPEDGQRQSSWLKWPEVAPEALKDFLNRCKSSRIAIPVPLWKDTVAKIDQHGTNGFSVELDATQHIVHLVGVQQDVDRGANDINKIIKELKEKAEFEAQQTIQDIKLTAEKLQPFIICGIKEKIENAYPDLKITITAMQDKIMLRFEGTRKNVQEAELLMRREMDSLECIEFKAGKNKVQFVHILKDKIHEILGSQGIRAACKGSDDGKIIISGATRKDATQAKAYVDHEIVDDVIPIRGKATLDVLQNQNGQKLLDSINNQRFVMAAISKNGGSVVELAGFKTNMDETKKKIDTFLKDNVIMMRLIKANKIKIRLITTFHGADLVNLEKQNAPNRVKIQPVMSGHTKGFTIQGNEEGLEAASQFLTSLVARIKEQPYPVSKTGMAQLFREDKGRKFLESLEAEFQCVISENVEEDEEEVAGSGGALMTTEVLCRFSLPNGFILKVCRGDLTRQKVDCIVNAANVELKHVGGLAAAIVEAGGRVIQTECEQILKDFHRRELFVGEPVYTSSGSLPCKKVIHVAGPKWPHGKTARPKTDEEPSFEEHLLYNSVLACLKLANQLKMKSIAIPAISTGVYGFPVELASRQILNAVAYYIQNTLNPILTEIHLTNNDQPTCNVFRQTVMNRFKQYQEEEVVGFDVDVGSAGASWDTPVTEDDTPVPAPAPKFTASGQNTLTTNEGINITLKKGSITNETVDVTVNTAGSDMKLNNGKVSQTILQVAGLSIQQECDALTATRGKIPSGDFIETGPGALTCKKIYHCVCAGYQPGVSEKALKKLILRLMEQAEQNEMLSIAIPALGTGNLNYPAGVTAQVMYESILEFSNLHPNGVLKDVRFVVYDKDASTIQGFEGEIQRLLTPGISRGATGYAPTGRSRKLKKPGSASTPTDRQSYSEIRRDHTGMLQTKIGSVCLQVGQGDLIKETTDAIVNSVGPGLDLQGPVSKAILAHGGSVLLDECQLQRKKEPKKLVYVTTSGSLQCNSIFHVVTPQTPEEIKTIVFKTLKQAEEGKLKSVSFPALGTGKAGQSVEDCANAMLKAVGEFAVQRKPRHLHLIRLVIFLPNMVSGFQDALHREVGTSYKKQKGWLSKGLDLAKSALSTLSSGTAAADELSEEESLQETIILNICAMDMSSIRKAVDKIDQFQSEEYMSEDRPDDHGMIGKMTDEHIAEVKAIEKKYNVKISCPRGKCVRVQGRVISVKDAHIQIQKMFTKMQKEELEAQRIELLSKQVQWKYSTPHGVEAYDPEVNTLIEDAYNSKRPSVTLNLEEGKVTIHFKDMQEVSRAGTLNVHRIDLTKVAAFEMPSNWIPMGQNEHFKMAPLTAGTNEYITVETQFNATMAGHQIQEIQRVQNKDLLMQYQARKAAMEARLGRPDVEKTLYHGTDETTSDKINKQGFNRSFCGKNATVYGNGTYFAVNANYSAQPQYAKPNASGVKHVFVTKVLVGDYTRGSQGMITPPNKPSHPDQQYDSVVDNANQPGIFVVFQDAQAYPEFLIKFT
ncbi:poly [ADP-ribose] polymerase 14-like [Acanthaster planci]|uniref:Poly [ADP-ribose] polymerase n=1 Tax=Acanthaster planci TaxID=133434 RepID=A0A8B7YGF6_ACAPL|nr:poly [ADP-ribose] polymerase 14-like [Acanthaster planci]